jgi:type IV pilus assembly protein PilA
MVHACDPETQHYGVAVMRHSRGFTLIELMIVVAIIAILAAIAVPAYQDYTIRAQTSECTRLIAGARVAVADYYQDTGTMPADNTEAGMPAATSISGSYVSQIEINNGVIICTFSAASPRRANIAINGVTMSWTPTVNAGSVVWDCSSTAPPRYLPTTCR